MFILDYLMYRNLQCPRYWDLGLPHTMTDVRPTTFCRPPLAQSLRTSSSWRMEYVQDTVGGDSSTMTCSINANPLLLLLGNIRIRLVRLGNLHSRPHPRLPQARPPTRLHSPTLLACSRRLDPCRNLCEVLFDHNGLRRILLDIRLDRINDRTLAGCNGRGNLSHRRHLRLLGNLTKKRHIMSYADLNLLLLQFKVVPVPS